MTTTTAAGNGTEVGTAQAEAQQDQDQEQPQERVGPVTAAVAVRQAKEGGSIAAFASEDSFQAAQRMARALSSSSLVPKDYQGPDGLPNCLIAMEMANRIGASVFMVMQQLDVIHGRPSWRSTFLIATVNTSGRFSPLRFRFQGEQGTDEWGCRAYATDRSTGEECVGSLVTIGLAKAEGWYGKSGSKWKTMPEQMLMYRAAAFWTRVYAPELSMGMHTSDEVADMELVDEGPSAGARDLEAALRQRSGPQRVAAPVPAAPEPEAQQEDKPAADSSLDGLAKLRTKAREADAMTADLEDAVERALQSGSAAAVRQGTKLLSSALARKASGATEQPSMLDGEG